MDSCGDDLQARVANLNDPYENTVKMKIGVHHNQFVITKVGNIFASLLIDRRSYYDVLLPRRK